MYLTYDEYVEMGGTLDESTFDDLAFEACAKVDWYTFNRLRGETADSLPEAVRRCVYRLIAMIQEQQSATMPSTQSTDGGIQAGIASQSNDGVSVSYNILSARDIIDSMDTRVQKIISQYLQDVRNSLDQRVLYRGIYPNE